MIDAAEIERWKKASQPVIEAWIKEMRRARASDGAALLEEAAQPDRAVRAAERPAAMAESTRRASARLRARLGRALSSRRYRRRRCSAALVLIALILLTVVSVVGRALFSAPIPGDFELVEIGMAVAVFAFLPYCQLRARPRHRRLVHDQGQPRAPGRWLDGIGNLLFRAMPRCSPGASRSAALEMRS